MSKTTCDNATEFECISGSIKFILRSSVKNRVQDCSDGSDKNVVNFICFEYEFRFFKYLLPINKLLNSSLDRNFNLMIFGGIQKLIYVLLIKRLTMADRIVYKVKTKLFKRKLHPQSAVFVFRPKQMLTKKITIQWNFNLYWWFWRTRKMQKRLYFKRYFLSNKFDGHDLSSSVVIFTNKSFYNIKNFNKNESLKSSKLFFQKYNFGLKCKTTKRHYFVLNGRYLDKYLTSWFNAVSQPKILSNKTFCTKKEDKCINNQGNFNCFRWFDGTVILKRQVWDRFIDCFDLSDESTCEKSESKQFCDVFYNNTRLHKKQIDFNIFCN